MDRRSSSYHSYQHGGAICSSTAKHPSNSVAISIPSEKGPCHHSRAQNNDSTSGHAFRRVKEESLLKDSVATGMNPSKTTLGQSATRRSNGFKSVVIYVLLFLNFVIATKLLTTHWQPPFGHSLTNSRGSSYNNNNKFRVFEDPTDGGNEGGNNGDEEENPFPFDLDFDFWIKMALIVFLVMIGGIFAGLTIGLMGLDETNLHVLMASGSPTEQVHAETVFKLLSRGKHWVLVTLLLGNVIVNETLPVVLDSELGGGVVAILISTGLIVIFGEIIPQAVCARYGLAIGAFCAKPMLFFMYIMSPVAYPIAMLLDSWLGVHHGTTYRRTELKTLVSLHQVDGIGELTDDEVTIIASVLDLKDKPVSMVMTPLEDVFTLSEDSILDEELMEEIVSAGYSRIPIYRHDDPNNFIGMLLVKRLITYDPEDHIAVRQFPINSLPEAAPNTSCLDILNFFQEGRSHMAIVTSEPGPFGYPVGVITLEDVIEELLGEEIVDESDVYVDVHNKIRVIRKPTRNVSMIKNLKTLLQSPALSDAATPLLSSSNVKHNATTNATAAAVAAATAAAAATGTEGYGEVIVPVDGGNNYLSTGKTILQAHKSMMDHPWESAPHFDKDNLEHDCAFRTDPFTKHGSPLDSLAKKREYGSMPTEQPVVIRFDHPEEDFVATSKSSNSPTSQATVAEDVTRSPKHASSAATANGNGRSSPPPPQPAVAAAAAAVEAGTRQPSQTMTATLAELIQPDEETVTLATAAAPPPPPEPPMIEAEPTQPPAPSTQAPSTPSSSKKKKKKKKSNK